MITITKDQALQRWDTLPPVLREALFSEPNSDFIWKTCANEHVPDKAIFAVAKVTGWVLMGFLHPEDVAEDLKERLNLNPQTAASIEDAINRRIFDPLQSNIEKIYQPLGKFEGGPKMIQDIGPATPATQVSPRASSSAPMPTARPMPAPASVPMPAALPPVSATPAPVMKPSFSGSGWSRLTPEAPVVKLSQTSTPPPSPAAKPFTPPAISKFQASPASGVVDEFERHPMPPTPSAPGTPAMPTSPAAPVASAGPAPVMLHQDTTFKTQQAAPDFRLPTPTESIDMKKVNSAPPVRPAVLELGNAGTPTTQTAPASTPRVIHYSEYKSPSPEAPIAPQGPRQVTEMTAPAAPKPSMPPTPPQNKVVYKDYSEAAPSPTPPKPPMPPTPPAKT